MGTKIFTTFELVNLGLDESGQIGMMNNEEKPLNNGTHHDPYKGIVFIWPRTSGYNKHCICLYSCQFLHHFSTVRIDRGYSFVKFEKY